MFSVAGKRAFASMTQRRQLQTVNKLIQGPRVTLVCNRTNIDRDLFLPHDVSRQAAIDAATDNEVQVQVHRVASDNPLDIESALVLGSDVTIAFFNGQQNNMQSLDDLYVDGNQRLFCEALYYTINGKFQSAESRSSDEPIRLATFNGMQRHSVFRPCLLIDHQYCTLHPQRTADKILHFLQRHSACTVNVCGNCPLLYEAVYEVLSLTFTKFASIKRCI